MTLAQFNIIASPFYKRPTPPTRGTKRHKAEVLGRRLRKAQHKAEEYPTHKICKTNQGNGCGAKKPLKEFHCLFTSKDGRASMCRVCTANRRAELGWK